MHNFLFPLQQTLPLGQSKTTKKKQKYMQKKTTNTKKVKEINMVDAQNKDVNICKVSLGSR